jgi:CO/xanthine dehydrogenase Mo-binding subunit
MRRVVITGVGAISPIGLTAGETWKAALEGKSGVGPITKFDTTDFAVKIAAEVKGFDPLNYMDRKQARQMDTFIHYAVAAAKEALRLINVEYEVLPHVTDVDAAMKPGAPIVQDGRADESVAAHWSPNVTSHFEFGHGDLEAGFAKAELIVERSFKTAATHQGYIEPHACLASLGTDGRGELWCCTQGHYNVRTMCSEILGIDASQLRVTASEIGGGFGGKTTVFLEPVALVLSRKSGRPVKMTMTRDEVFRASGPTASTSIDIKIGMTKDGKITVYTPDIPLRGDPQRIGP